ncbi:MAG: zinc ribbon domain-containing protein [Armatimonadetes bacterium]|nr:zinc ribbon domain-containing protein [Armatimonadota bacterium]
MRLESPACPNCGSKDIDQGLKCLACEAQLIWIEDSTLRVEGLSVACPKCRATNDATHRFCVKCGHELAFFCPVCRTSHLQGTLFCPHTGKSIRHYQDRAEQRVDRPRRPRKSGSKKDVMKLIQRVSAEEEKLSSTQFVAPSVAGGALQARVDGLLHTFLPEPRSFEGWGIFRPTSQKSAELVEEATLPQVMEYLRLMTSLRLRLVARLEGRTWLAYPVNESDAAQRLGGVRPMPVHLVEDGVAFEQIVAGWDGRSLWFQEIDRRSDPHALDRLQQALRQLQPPQEVRFPGCTPEMLTVYEMVLSGSSEYLERRRQEARAREDRRRRLSEEQILSGALRAGGGELSRFVDRGEYWTVDWRTADGQFHTSAIAKDLTVMGAGICLSGEDVQFDLQSLVGVVEGADQR